MRLRRREERRERCHVRRGVVDAWIDVETNGVVEAGIDVERNSVGVAWLDVVDTVARSILPCSSASSTVRSPRPSGAPRR